MVGKTKAEYKARITEVPVEEKFLLHKDGQPECLGHHPFATQFRNRAVIHALREGGIPVNPGFVFNLPPSPQRSLIGERSSVPAISGGVFG